MIGIAWTNVLCLKRSFLPFSYVSSSLISSSFFDTVVGGAVCKMGAACLKETCKSFIHSAKVSLVGRGQCLVIVVLWIDYSKRDHFWILSIFLDVCFCVKQFSSSDFIWLRPTQLEVWDQLWKCNHYIYAACSKF